MTESGHESCDAMIDAYRAEIETQTDRANRLEDILRRIELWPFNVMVTPENDLRAIKALARKARKSS